MADIAFSFSGLRDLQISPLRYWARHIDPDRVSDETPAKRVGSALHCAVLEPDQFDSRYVRAFDPGAYANGLDTVADLREFISGHGVQPRGAKKADLIVQAKAVMAGRNDFRPILCEIEEGFEAAVAASGVTVLHHTEWEAVQRMTEAVQANPHAMALLRGGEAEASRAGEMHIDGYKVPLRGKIDYATPDYHVDLKTFHHRAKSMEAALADIIYYERYHYQAAFYRYLGHADRQDWDHYLIFVENDPPWEVRVIKLTRRHAGARMSLYWHMAENDISRLAVLFARCCERFGHEQWRIEEMRTLRDEDIRQLAWEVQEGWE